MTFISETGSEIELFQGGQVTCPYWFWQLLEPIGYFPPAEVEELYYRVRRLRSW